MTVREAVATLTLALGAILVHRGLRRLPESTRRRHATFFRDELERQYGESSPAPADGPEIVAVGRDCVREST